MGFLSDLKGLIMMMVMTKTVILTLVITALVMSTILISIGKIRGEPICLMQMLTSCLAPSPYGYSRQLVIQSYY